MNSLVSIEDLGRPVTPEEYLVVCTKTAISIELLFKTNIEEVAEAMMGMMLRGMAERLNKDLVKFTQHVHKASNQMAFSGFFRSLPFQKLIDQIMETGIPDEEESEKFFEWVMENSKIAKERLMNLINTPSLEHAPPPGTKLN